MDYLKNGVEIEKGYKFYIARVDVFTDIQRLDRKTAHKLMLLIAEDMNIKKDTITEENAYNYLKFHGSLEYNMKLEQKHGYITYNAKSCGGGAERSIIVLDGKIIKHKEYAQVCLKTSGKVKINNYFKTHTFPNLTYDTMAELHDNIEDTLTNSYNKNGVTYLLNIDKFNSMNLLKDWDMSILVIKNGWVLA